MSVCRNCNSEKIADEFHYINNMRYPHIPYVTVGENKLDLLMYEYIDMVPRFNG